MKKRWLFLRCLFIFAIIGCTGHKDPSPQSDTASHQLDIPSVEDAKAALVHLLTNPILPMAQPSDWAEIASAIQSETSLNRLDKGEITSDAEKGLTFIGGWTCVLPEKKCFTVLHREGEECRVNGRFRKTNGKWEVIVLCVDYATLRP